MTEVWGMRVRLESWAGAISTALYSIRRNLQPQDIQASNVRRFTVNFVIRWLWHRLLVGVQGKNSSPKKGDDQGKPGPQSWKDCLARQFSGTGNKRVKIIMWVLVLGWRRNSAIYCFSQARRKLEAEFLRTKLEFLNFSLTTERNQMGLQGTCWAFKSQMKRSGMQKEERGRARAR